MLGIRAGTLLVALLAASALGCAGEPTRPSVVIVLIDTLRADHLGCYGYQRPTSPAIDALAARGALFEQAGAVASYTRASTASLLTGLYPAVHGAVTRGDAIAPGVATLAEILRDAGYRTAGFHLNVNVSAQFGFDRGFETYEHAGAGWYSRHPEIERGLVASIDDRAVTELAVPWLEAAGAEPFFLYLHLIGPHDPYTPPPESFRFTRKPLSRVAELFYQQPADRDPGEAPVIGELRRGELRLDERGRRQLVDLYDDEIAFSDRQVGAVLDALDRLGRLERTLVVVTSDHGEEFWEHGGVGHGHSHYEELLRVPLAIAGPGVSVARIATPVSLVDLLPTLLDYLDLEGPADLQGRSFAAAFRGGEPAGRPLYAEGLLRTHRGLDPIMFRSLRSGRHKLLLDFQRRRKALFDLGGDPGERRDLLAAEPRLGRRLFEELAAIHHRNLERSPAPTAEPAAMPPEVEAQLRALGYLGDGAEADGATEERRPGWAVFRRPLRSLDPDPLGWMGDEQEVADYRPALDLQAGGWPLEQLLYGWHRIGGGPRWVINVRAGVRLSRSESAASWRIRGVALPGVTGGRRVSLEVRVDGGAPATARLPRRGRFELHGPLPPGGGRTVRLDLECLVGKVTEGAEIKDEQARCARVDYVGVEDEAPRAGKRADAESASPTFSPTAAQ